MNTQHQSSSKPRTIGNISNWQLSVSEKSVINKSLNFAITFKQVPYLEINKYYKGRMVDNQDVALFFQNVTFSVWRQVLS